MANQVQNKPTAAYILSLLGGIFGILLSLWFIIPGILAMIVSGTIGAGELIAASGIYLGVGIWVLISSILTISFAGKLKGNPMEHSKYGAYILVFSLIGCWTGLSFIGGILALVYKPIPAAPQYSAPAQPYTTAPAPPPPTTAGQPITRFCPGCGRVVNENVKFCPHCGKALG